MDKEFSNIRIVDIAKMAGVSVGTVDRVIHNRGRVSEENRKKVQAILEMVHYQPNLMARSLAASKKQYHLLAITPSFVQGEYWEAISEGIDKAASEMESYNITITKLFFDQYNNKTFDDIIRNLLNEKVDGVLIATLFTDSVIRLSQELDRNEIPYVYVDSNIGGQHQLAYFGTESYDAGVIAARLLMDRLSSSSDILMARIIHSGKNDSNQGKNRREGFCHYLTETGFNGNLHEVELKINDSVYNFMKLDEIFEADPLAARDAQYGRKIPEGDLRAVHGRVHEHDIPDQGGQQHQKQITAAPELFVGMIKAVRCWQCDRFCCGGCFHGGILLFSF